MSKLIVLTEEQAAEMIQRNVAAATHGAVEHLAKRVQELEQDAYAAKPVLSRHQAAKYADVSIATFDRWIAAGLPVSKQGAKTFIARNDLDSWLMKNKTTQTNPGSLRLAA